ncbi:hypothetical protein ACE1ET_19235 [Saccharicrinis sp. FJH62]|uniref:hypothetical protein n=1 Tax=Saccharicrinis sp. FJH62 TaxID=3344657 RepID=UPI0035D43F34
MKLKLKIELFEQHDEVNFYTLRFEKDETEVDKFLNKFPEGCEYDEDIDILIKWIDQIGGKGALERYFRPEGKYTDYVYAIPIETCNLRLYVIRLSENVVILGNGGIKTTKTYNEDNELNTHVELLQEISGYIRNRLINKKIVIHNKTLSGNLSFYLSQK